MKYKQLLILVLLISLNACTSIHRIQTPSPPFNYDVAEVTVENCTDNIMLNGILTTPLDTKDFPVVILVSGSGPHNYDEEWSGHKPFWVIADYLTKRGIGVLRMNDRDFDKDPIDFYQNTTADFTKDVLSAVKFLQNFEKTKNSSIGLLGHSEGGIVCSMVAAENPDISFLILLGTPGVTMDKFNISAAELSYQIAGTPEDVMQNLLKFNQEYFEIVNNYKTDTEAKKQVEALYDTYFKNTDMYDKSDRYNLISRVALPWYRYMYQNDPAVYFNRINIPVLAIIGEFDSQVTPEMNLQVAARFFNGKNELNKIMEMKNLNHMLQPTDRYKDYSLINETVSTELLNEIFIWMQTL
ncbi:MAG: alpha/beta fold hydrolase [Ignavibacteriales bacterium]|nr:alpha/beta fold hydrolase [Ignavibacteriales bacterium]